MSRYSLNRRTVLRGLIGGSLVTVGLPMLEAMLDDNGTAYADGAGLPVRFVSFYWADGVLLSKFEPAAAGATWSLNTQMAPLAPVKDYLNVITGLENLYDGGPITHHEGMTVFNAYSYTNVGGLNSDSGGPTLDQLIADILESRTPQRAVHVQNSKRVSTDGDGGTTAIALSHRGVPGSLTPQTPQVNPQIVWQSLFGTFADPVDTRPPRLRVLDAVRADANRLRKRLGSKDQSRLDAHLDAVDELESKISAAPPACELPMQPAETNADVAGEEPISSVNAAMSSLIAYAFACDITRVATYMFKRFVSGTVFDEISAGDVHHSQSHNSNGGQGTTTYDQGVTYMMEKFSEFLQTLMNTEDATGGNLLDSTIVYASTECSTPWQHSTSRQPIILAGHGRNYLKYPGVHYTATPFSGNNENPNAAGNTSDALFTCLRAFDPAATSIGAGGPQSSSVISDVIA